ncbi:MAG: NosD domain-containing protein [Candidatus Oleimicrobiaceae bacterium]
MDNMGAWSEPLPVATEFTTVPLDQAPSCSIRLLDKDTGSQITQIEVNKLLHNHVTASDDYRIAQVRFSSDDFQDGSPTGTWTEWLSWGSSSNHRTGYWDPASKKKEWAFTTTGNKVWAEVKDNSGQTKKANAHITAVPQVVSISVSPISVAFGNVAVGQSSDRNVTITNQSTSTGTLSGNVSVVGTDFWIASGGGSYSLSPGQSRIVTVRFSPTAATSRSGTLVISHNATNQSSPINVSLTGTGTSIISSISVSPTSVDFGNLAVGQSSDRDVTITNQSTSTGTLSGNVSVVGTDFWIASGGGSYSLSPGQSRIVTVRFSPTAATSRVGTLVISHNATNQCTPINVSLSGTGARGKIITVCPSGCNYTSIRSAINGASTGDTVEVQSGIYYEYVNVDKQVILRGIDTGRGRPVVDGGGKDDVITISADGVTLEGFEVRNSRSGGWGIWVTSNKNILKNNTASNNLVGIGLYYSSGNTLINNTALSNCLGISLWSCDNNILANNNASLNECDGIALSGASNNTLANITASSNGQFGIALCGLHDGIHLTPSNNNTLTNNIANSNQDGIYISESSDNTLADNTANSNSRSGLHIASSNNNMLTNNTADSNGYYAVMLSFSSNNKIYLNNFMNSPWNVLSYESSTNAWNSTEKRTYIYKGKQYTNYLGNYWSDYTGSDADNDGIGDTPYSITGNNDNYLLMGSFARYVVVGVEEESSSLELPGCYTLSQNYPNPFNSETVFQYQLFKKSWVTIKVFSLRGKEIRTLVNEEKEPGYFTTYWDGKDGFGKDVGSGVFLYQIKRAWGDFVTTRKMLLLR